VLSFILLSAVIPSASAGDISYDLPLNESIAGGGGAFGQVLTAPNVDNVLYDFTIPVATNHTTDPFTLQVYAWNGSTSTVTGSPLYVSPTQTALYGFGGGPEYAFTNFTFTPNIALSPGGQYMALVSATPPFPTNEELVVGGSLPGTYTGGVFYVLGSFNPLGVNDAPSLAAGPWGNAGNGTDLAFSADFVPEPSGLPLLIIVAISILARRRMAGGGSF